MNKKEKETCEGTEQGVKLYLCVCTAVGPGVHGGGVAEGVERVTEAGIQRTQNTLQRQRHQRVRPAIQPLYKAWAPEWGVFLHG